MATLADIIKFKSWLVQQFSSPQTPTTDGIIAITPFHCSRCKFIWDTKDKFKKHFCSCLHNPEFIKLQALQLKIDYYDDLTSNKGGIPKGRCRCKLQSGHRKGKYCLRKSQYPGGYRCCHHPFTITSTTKAM